MGGLRSLSNQTYYSKVSFRCWPVYCAAQRRIAVRGSNLSQFHAAFRILRTLPIRRDIRSPVTAHTPATYSAYKTDVNM